MIKYVRHINLLKLILVKVTFYKLLKILEPHLPGLALFRLHLVESCLAQPAADMFLKPIVEERAPT